LTRLSSETLHFRSAGIFAILFATFSFAKKHSDAKPPQLQSDFADMQFSDRRPPAHGPRSQRSSYQRLNIADCASIGRADGRRHRHPLPALRREGRARPAPRSPCQPCAKSVRALPRTIVSSKLRRGNAKVLPKTLPKGILWSRLPSYLNRKYLK
jgi:hypothetical protein